MILFFKKDWYDICFLKNENVYLQCKKINKNKNKKVMRTKINSQSTAARNSASKCIVNALEKSLKKINKIENSDNPMFSGWVKVKEDVRMSVWAGRCYDAETQTYSFSGSFALESKNDRDKYTTDVDCLVGITSTERMTDDQCVNYVIEEFIKMLDSLMTKYNSGPFSGIGHNAYVIKYCYFGGAKNEAPSLDEAPMLEDDDITEDGYSVAGLKYLAENMPVVPVDAIVEGVNEYFSDHCAVVRKRCMGFYECEFEEFCDIVWSYVWPIVCPMSDDALEAETRYYMEFNDRLRYMIDNRYLGALYIYNEGYIRSRFDDVAADSDDDAERIAAVIKEYYNNYIPSYLDQFGECVITVYWNRFSEADMMMLIENEEVALAVRDILLSDNVILDKNGFLVYDDGVYLTVDYNKIANKVAA